jgi:hypothetical protein
MRDNESKDKIIIQNPQITKSKKEGHFSMELNGPSNSDNLKNHSRAGKQWVTDSEIWQATLPMQ